MMSRLAFAMATQATPDILLLDEWIGAGDASFQARSYEKAMDMIGASGIVVMCSHNESLLRQVCTHGLWLDAGKIVFYGAIGPVLDAYNLRYTPSL
jgi:ABC-type polysaccharide/polyol phosphate transport system ATPase subunit